MKYSEGDQVLALSPSTEEYEKAKVLERKGTNKYILQFRGGVEVTVNEKDIKVIQIFFILSCNT